MEREIKMFRISARVLACMLLLLFPLSGVGGGRVVHGDGPGLCEGSGD